MATRFRVQICRALAAVALAGGTMPVVAKAAFIMPTNWARPADDAAAVATLTTYQEWDVFTATAGPNDPDIAEINPNPGIGPNASKANVYDTSGTSFITSGGNIYSFSAPTEMKAEIPSYGLGSSATTVVLFQLRTLGTEVDSDNVHLLYNDGADQSVSYVERIELERIELGGFGGYQVDTLFRFEIPFSPGTFRIEFDSLESSMSTDRVAVDTFTTVPEPASLAALALGGVTLLIRRQSRRQSA